MQVEDRIGDYIGIKPLAKSPFGSLVLAEHVLLKRRVALKMLSPSLLEGKETAKLFEEEISCLAEVDHPHIMRLQNVGFHESGGYLIYDWVSSDEEPAQSLSSYLEQGDEETLFFLAKQIASALDFIRRKQLVHGGVKSSNVLIKEEEGIPKAYLSDMGLSRLVSSDRFLKHLLHSCLQEKETMRSFWESFHSLAPEQKRDFKQKSPSDAYAFGVLLYEQLLGHFPEGRCPLPSEKVPSLKYRWDELLTACLDPNPEKRPQELLLALESIGKQESSLEGAFKLKLNPRQIERPQFEPDPGAIFQTETTIVRYQPTASQPKSLEPLASEMKIIPGGEFFRGSMQGARDEGPRHSIRLSPFAMDVHPVSNEQFVLFLEVMGGEKEGNNNDMIRLKESRIKRIAGKLTIESGYSKHPVVGVTWYGAIAYAKWVGKRLPTEAEWEIASMGGHEEALYPTGLDIQRSQANFFSSDTTAVMSYPPNDYGLFDMAGNVYEWCQDWYDYHYYEASKLEPNNPKGPAQGVYRVLRGGCWKSLKEDLRCSHRHRNNPGTVNSTYGFRCVADVSI